MKPRDFDCRECGCFVEAGEGLVASVHHASSQFCSQKCYIEHVLGYVDHNHEMFEGEPDE